MVYYVRQASYDPPEQPLLNREVRGRLRAGRRLATPAQIGSQSTVALQYLVLVEYCRGAAGITGYKFRRRCTAMVWLALTNALTRLDLGHITKLAQAYFRRSSIPMRVARDEIQFHVLHLPCRITRSTFALEVQYNY